MIHVYIYIYQFRHDCNRFKPSGRMSSYACPCMYIYTTCINGWGFRGCARPIGLVVGIHQPGSPWGRGFWKCVQWSLQNTALHRFLAHALQMYACTCITNEMRMLQITNDMCILHQITNMMGMYLYMYIYIYSYIHNYIYIYMHTHHSRSHKLATNHLLYHRFLFTLRNGQGHRFFIAERPQLGPLGRM